MPWRAIAKQLQGLGLDVDYNAVIRYAQKVGIPTGRVDNVGIDAPQPTSRADAEPVAATGPSADALVIGELIAGVIPTVMRIEQAKLTDDPDVMQRSLQDAITWFQQYGEKAPPDFRQRILDAIAGLKRFLVETPASKAPPPSATIFDQYFQGTEPKPNSNKSLFVPGPKGLIWHVDTPMIRFPEGDGWSLRDSFEGTLVVGATGSGKTSGSGRALAVSFLANGMGGLVLTAKEDERALWENYARQTRRTDQLCIVKPGGPFKFNFLDYQTRLPNERGGSTENVVELFHSVLEAFSRTKRTADTFWTTAVKQLLRNLVRVLRAAGEPFSLKTLRRFVGEMPRDIKAVQAGAWKTTPTFGRLIALAKRQSRDQQSVGTQEAIQYWTAEFPELWHETRSIITADFTALIDLFFEDAIWPLFCEETTITPEAVFDGAIVVVDLPIKKYHATGRLAQLFWKHLFQLAVERRSDADDAARRPVFLWADEAQHFAGDSDLLFQATARSSRCATVYLTQTLPGFQAAMGGHQARERTDGLFANLTTKILHANGDPATNEWAATQIGRVLQYRANVQTSSEAPSHGGHGLQSLFQMLNPVSKRNVSTSQVVDFQVQPSEFMKLRTGSAKNDRMVEAYFVKPGATYSTGKHYFKATFEQEKAS